MKFIATGFEVLLVWLPLVASAQTNFWQQANGPYGGTINAIAVNQSGHIYAGTGDARVYKSIDNGLSWTYTEVTRISSVEELAINANGHVFAGMANGGVYRSIDNGNTWEQKNNGLIRPFIGALTVDSDGRIYAGSSSGTNLTGGVFRSTDNGENWFQMNNGLTTGFINAFAFDTTGNIMTATGDGVFISEDNGENWNQISTFRSAQALAVHENGHFYAGTRNDIFRSMDSGQNWDRVHSNVLVEALAITDAGHILAATFSKKIFRSEDNGDTWNDSSAGLTNPFFWDVITDNNGNVWAGSPGGGVFKSIDCGKNWKVSNLINSVILTFTVSKSGSIFAGGDELSGIFRSDDNGSNWRAVNNGLVWLDVLSLAMQAMKKGIYLQELVAALLQAGFTDLSTTAKIGCKATMD